MGQIQLKYGSQSAVPTGLLDGEFAINLDTNQLYYGSGSAVLSDLRLNKITAESYVISSSVTHMTTSFSSGSTEFGDSADDTHTFTGHITSSGNISASGNIYANRFGNNLEIIDNSAVTTIAVDSAAGTGNSGLAFMVDGTTKINLQKGVLPTTFNGNTLFSSPITASGDISASGTATANTLRLTSTTDASATSTGHAFQTGLTSAVNIIIDNNEIMARNNGSTANLHLNADGGSVFFHNNVANSNTVIGVGGHITASGHISSSGNIIASNIQDIATTNSPTFAGLTLNPTGEGQTNIISSQAVDLKIATTHASTNRDVGIELSGSGAQYSLALDRANDLFVIATSTVGAAPSNAKLTLNATGDLSTEGTIKAGWHGSTTRIKILVSDFIPDDVGRPAMIDDATSDRWLESHGSAKLFASIPIPTGFKATHIRIYGSGTSAFDIHEMDIDSKTVTNKGSGNIGTELDFTDVTSDATNYLLIEIQQASGEEVYGGYITIAEA